MPFLMTAAIQGVLRKRFLTQPAELFSRLRELR
jgi:hypothetical protein